MACRQYRKHEGDIQRTKRYELIFDDAQQKQENQIKAIRTFIQQDVDYIVFSPKVETGWNSILQEAKDAGIPVIVTDRYIEAEDESL
jgi:simple sugar transport system substrate-binding protein